MGLTNVLGWGNNLAALKAKVKWRSVTGAAAATNIAVPDIATKDTIVVCYNATDKAYTAAQPVPTSAGNVQFPAGSATMATKTLVIGFIPG